MRKHFRIGLIITPILAGLFMIGLGCSFILAYLVLVHATNGL